jgi:hypothetical protein
LDSFALLGHIVFTAQQSCPVSSWSGCTRLPLTLVSPPATGHDCLRVVNQFLVVEQMPCFFDARSLARAQTTLQLWL